MADVTVVERMQEGDRLTFSVTVTEGASETSHEVTVAKAELERLSREDESGEQFIGRCFGFLLEREPKESIMNRFDLSVIKTYFPEFESEIG